MNVNDDFTTQSQYLTLSLQFLGHTNICIRVLVYIGINLKMKQRHRT
jgi:hypothetical protein